ncbi:MAG TPA: GNAT family N-acetyltransferase [Candidatus Dormibacteraeota bacterium]|nr:GNAT family N-acetyltransferase [Candidatus Dormibacteraeota bacterium]
MLTQDDWEVFRTVRLAALREAPYAFGSTYEREVEAPESRWRDGLLGRTRFVAEVDGEVVGTVSGGAADTAGSAAVTAMWVDPRFRRAGIGDALLKHVLEWLKRAAYRDVVLWVTEVNASAERLYERNGFRRTGGVSEVRPGEPALEYEMSRRL